MAYDLIKISALPETTPDESQDIVVGVGDYAKRINYGAVKADMVGTSPTYTTDTEPYLMRQTAHVGVVGKCALNKLVGGSLGWNQLIADNKKTGTATIGSNGYASVTNILNMPDDHAIFCAAKLASTNNSRIRLVGNRNGAYAERSSEFTTNGKVYILSKLSQLSANDGIIVRIVGTAADSVSYDEFAFYDLTVMFGSIIADYVYSLETSSSGSGIAKLKSWGIDLDTYHAYDAGSIQSVQATEHVTSGYNQWDEEYVTSATIGEYGGNFGSKNYIPVMPNVAYYFTSSYNIPSSGLRLAYYDSNKTLIKSEVKYARTVTMPSGCRYLKFGIQQSVYGTTYNHDICINISKTTGTPKNGDYVPYSGHTYPLGSDTLRGIPQLVNTELAFDGDEKLPDGTITRKYGIRAYQSGDVSDGSTMLTDGTNTVYKLTSPTTETSTAFQRVQTVDADGTESFTTSTPVPVGHETQYPDNVLAALEWLGE